MREVFSQDAREKLSFVPGPAEDGETVLLQMCARCHDGRSDPKVSKSRFNVKMLTQMSRAEKDVAIARLTASGDLRMPPWRVGELTPAAIQAATRLLTQ